MTIHTEEVRPMGKKLLACLFEPLVGREVRLVALHLGKLTPGDAPELKELHDSSVFRYVQGMTEFLFIPEDDMGGMDAEAFLASAGIEVDCGKDTVQKRAGRMFSPRDAVGWLLRDEVNVLILQNDDPYGIRQFEQFTPEKVELIRDGFGVISTRFFAQLCRENNISRHLRRRAKGVTFGAVMPEGMIKAYFNVVKTSKMPVTSEDVPADIATGVANLKKDMWTSNGAFIYAFDLAMPYGMATVSFQMEAMTVGFMVEKDSAKPFHGINLLNGELRKSLDAIKSGDASQVLRPMDRPRGVKFLEDSLGINEDFAFLPNMVTDMAMRGWDYRWSPTCISQLGTTGSNRWYDQRKDWYKLPLPCARYMPIISEASARLMGHGVIVKPGQPRYLAKLNIFVVNDHDYVDFVIRNSGGGDQDDMWILLQRLVDGVRKWIAFRYPIGWREFSVFEFVEGDEEFVYMTYSGKTVKFPPVPGKVPMPAAEQEAKGLMKTGPLPVASKPQGWMPPATYTQYVDQAVNDLAGTKDGVGLAINVIMAAACSSKRKELLSTLFGGMEEIVDGYTKVIDPRVREAITKGVEDLLEAMNKPEVIIDPMIRDRRLPYKATKAMTVREGYPTKTYWAHESLRAWFTGEVHKFAQEEAQKGNPLLDAILGFYGMTRKEFPNRIRALAAGKAAEEVLIAFNTEAASIAKMTRQLRAAGKLPRYDEEYVDPQEAEPMIRARWKAAYDDLERRIKKICKNDAENMDFFVTLLWVLAMCSPQKRVHKDEHGVPMTTEHYSDRVVMNSRLYPLFVRGMTKLGLASDICYGVGEAPDLLWEKGKVETSEYIAILVDSQTGRVVVTHSQTDYIRWMLNHKRLAS